MIDEDNNDINQTIPEEPPMAKFADPTPDQGEKDFPLPAPRFVESLIGGPDEIWTKWLMMQHGRENHLLTEWNTILDGYRHQSAY